MTSEASRKENKKILEKGLAGMVAYSYEFNTWEAEAGGLSLKLLDSLGYIVNSRPM